MPLLRSLNPVLLLEWVPIQQGHESFGWYAEQVERLGLPVVRIVEVGELVWLLQDDTDVAEVRALLDDSIVVHTCVVHHVHLAVDDEVDIPCVLEGSLDDGQVDSISAEDVWVLLTRVIRAVVPEAEVEDQLPPEVKAAVLEDVREQLVFVLEEGIEHGFLQSWLELGEKLVVEDDVGGIVPELLLVEEPDIFEDLLGEDLLWDCFVKLDEPQVDELLVFFAKVL